MTVLVTGATGNVGREVVRVLRKRGTPVRVADRAAAGGRSDTVRFDYLDPSTFPSAAAGCSSVFLVRPPAIAKVKSTLNRFVDVARSVGVRHVVFLSVAGAESNRLVPHHAVESHLERRGTGWTILRPGFFAQNLGDAYRLDIVEDDRLYVPAGAGRAAFVDVRDIAEVAALALEDPPTHDQKAYTLTGPAAVGFSVAAAVLSDVLGRRVRYEAASVSGYARHLRSRGMPLGQIAVQTALHLGLRFGQAARVDATLERLLGRRGRSLRAYVVDHADTWRRPATG